MQQFHNFVLQLPEAGMVLSRTGFSIYFLTNIPVVATVGQLNIGQHCSVGFLLCKQQKL